ncbi:MAG: aminomethyltransferase beta-barrel domain-containing protein, partial [Ilumatobacteraceae bacterium]
AMTKADVRAHAARLGLRTAMKPDSQDVCFITSAGGRTSFLGARIPLRPATVLDRTGVGIATVPAIEMITLGQRRGIGLPGGGPKRYVVDIDVKAATITVGDEADLFVSGHLVNDMTWIHGAGTMPAEAMVLVQCSAHGTPHSAVVSIGVDGTTATITWQHPQRRVAPGQSVVLYDAADRFVLGGGIAGAAF